MPLLKGSPPDVVRLEVGQLPGLRSAQHVPGQPHRQGLRRRCRRHRGPAGSRTIERIEGQDPQRAGGDSGQPLLVHARLQTRWAPGPPPTPSCADIGQAADDSAEHALTTPSGLLLDASRVLDPPRLDLRRRLPRMLATPADRPSGDDILVPFLVEGQRPTRRVRLRGGQLHRRTTCWPASSRRSSSTRTSRSTSSGCWSTTSTNLAGSSFPCPSPRGQALQGSPRPARAPPEPRIPAQDIDDIELDPPPIYNGRPDRLRERTQPHHRPPSRQPDLCLYDLTHCSGDLIMNVSKTHRPGPAQRHRHRRPLLPRTGFPPRQAGDPDPHPAQRPRPTRPAPRPPSAFMIAEG